MSKKLITAEFISSAIKIHGNKYDYSKAIYNGNNIKVEIICPEHGSFWQIPYSHLSSHKGCPRCGKTGKLTTSLFIKKAKEVHKNKYDYSKSIYVSSHSPVTIYCKLHGDFNQLAYNHLNGKGCYKCGGTFRSNTSEFIQKCCTIHGNKYNYSRTKYSTNRNKVLIICKKHGEFLQTPNDHLAGKGCPRCVHHISIPEVKFLDYCNISEINRQKKILNFNVDGYDPQTNTIYEFLGDYWHGNPKIYKSDKYNIDAHLSFGDLYIRTMKRFEKIKLCGFRIKYIWESDWKRYKTGLVINPQIQEI